MSATDIGFNFRATAGFVTDGDDETYVRADDAYPTTRAGWTFGWEQLEAITNDRDRSSGVDRRLAGIVFTNTTGDTFRVDLPATGEYDVHGAFGDAAFTWRSNWDLKDTSTTFAQIRENAASPASAGQFRDATDTKYTTENWLLNETPVTRTFASTIFRCVEADAQSNSHIAHLRLVQQAASAAIVDSTQTILRLIMAG